MGLRYKIPFKDMANNAYEVQIYRADYEGDVTELTGATSCFVVSGTDEDFMYTPIRTSTATINVLDSELLLDLYSINNQYADVKLMKNGVMEWSGYIKPEQFTQPYVPMVQQLSVECVSALSTLEHFKYEDASMYGVVNMWSLIKKLIAYAKGSYRAVYIPWVYGTSESMIGNIFERITLIENNFVKEEMNYLEILEAVCKFLNWAVYEIKGCLFFVDADWKGNYRKYDDELESYEEVSGNEVCVQDVGFNGSGSNTIDVVPGYNKASVKALNHVFDDVVKDEAFDILGKYAGGEYLIETYKGNDGAHGVRRQFLKSMLWETYHYDDWGKLLDKSEIESYSPTVLNYTYGSLLAREADYKCVSTDDSTPAEGVTDFNYEDVVCIRVAKESTAQLPTAMFGMPVLKMKGEVAVYADCAISIDGTFSPTYDKDMVEVGTVIELTRTISIVVSCDGKYYDGSQWVDSYTTISVEVDENGKIISNRTPFTPYKDISGYVIPMDFFVGAPEITIIAPLFWGDGRHYNTGVIVKGLKFGYAKKEGVVDEGENGDRVYENIVNAAYMSEADEIEFDISSYNADGASYSKAILDGKWLTNNLYCKIVDKMIRPEELMIRRIVNRYGEVKRKLTQSLKMTDDITPLTILSDNAMVGIKFRMTSGEWDYEQNRLTIQMQEDVE